MTVYQAKRLGIDELLAAGLARAGAAGDRGDHGVADAAGCRRSWPPGTSAASWAPREYPPLAERYRVPIVVTGFEPLDILEGIRRTVLQLESGPPRGRERLPPRRAGRGQPGGEGHAARTSSRSPTARWRGIGDDPRQRLAAVASVPRLRRRAAVSTSPAIHTEESTLCRSGEVLQGLIKPHECAAFGKECTPRNPLGATMVSSEGACAAYYLYRRLELAPRSRGDAVRRSTQPRSTSTAGSAPCRCGTRPTIVMGHGGGGAMSGELIEHLFLPAFGDAADAELGDSAVAAGAGGARLAFSTDSFVVQAAVLPGRLHRRPGRQRHGQRPGHVGRARRCSCRRRSSWRRAPALTDDRPRRAGLGAAADARPGSGWSPATPRSSTRARRRRLHQHRRASAWSPTASTSGPAAPQPGDAVIVSGDIGVHGVAVMSCREGLEFGTTDRERHRRRCNGLVAGDARHRRRRPRAARPDPRRGRRVAERDRPGGRGRDRAGRARPAGPARRSRDACGLLGLDPL